MSVLLPARRQSWRSHGIQVLGGGARGICLYKLAEDIQQITCGQPDKIPFSMLIKVCEILGLCTKTTE